MVSNFSPVTTPDGPDGPDSPDVPADETPHRRRWRDRRGRGIRGPLFPQWLPAHRTRAEVFDDLVFDVARSLDERWAEQLAGTQFAVQDVPPSAPAPWEHGRVPLGRYFPAASGEPSRIVVYRRPIETRSADPEDLTDLVRDVVIEQVAHLLARSPEEIDPNFGER